MNITELIKDIKSHIHSMCHYNAVLDPICRLVLEKHYSTPTPEAIRDEIIQALQEAEAIPVYDTYPQELLEIITRHMMPVNAQEISEAVEQATLKAIHPPYYMIHNPSGRPPQHQHQKYSEAAAEADRLATQNPGQTFNILAVIESSLCPILPPVVTTYTFTEASKDELPF